MHKLKLFLGAILAIALVACEGPAGPPGPPGFDGIDGVDGVNILGSVLELEGINFEYDADANLFTTLPINFSDFDIEVFESDAILIYRYEGGVDLDDGSTADLWGQIPQNFFLAEGTIQYVFNHTFVDFEIFIDGNFDLSTLSTDFTDDQIFRVVVVPAEFANDPNIDFSNLGQVMKSMELDVSDIQKASEF